MRLSIGIPSLIFGAASGIHGALVLYGNVFAQSADLKRFGYALLVIAVLLVFSGAFALEAMGKAKKLFIAAFAVAVATTLFISYSAAAWAVLTLILVSLSEKVEPSKRSNSKVTAR